MLKEVFETFKASKRKSLLFWAFCRRIHNPSMMSLWSVRGLVMTKSKKKAILTFKNKVSLCFRIVTWMFLGHLGNVESIFYCLRDSKGKHFTFSGIRRPIHKPSLKSIWSVGRPVIKKVKNVIFELQKWSFHTGSGLKPGCF